MRMNTHAQFVCDVSEREEETLFGQRRKIFHSHVHDHLGKLMKEPTGKRYTICYVCTGCEKGFFSLAELGLHMKPTAKKDDPFLRDRTFWDQVKINKCGVVNEGLFRNWCTSNCVRVLVRVERSSVHTPYPTFPKLKRSWSWG